MNTKEYPQINEFNFYPTFKEELLLLLGLHFGKKMTIEKVRKLSPRQHEQAALLAVWLANHIFNPFK